MIQPKPVVLLILDGWGISTGQTGDAIHAARTPTWDLLMATAPHTTLSGSGEEVGLPVGQMGNSEVGHLTIGSGRVIDQDLSRISKSIQQGTFFSKSRFKRKFSSYQRNASHFTHSGVIFTRWRS